MEMKNIFKYAVIATALSAGIFSCSEDEFAKDEQNSQVVSVGGLKIQVGDFPSESLRSSVPGFEAGKSAWENGDQIKLTISFDGGKAESSTIEYQNGLWSTSSLPLYPSSDSKIELVAEYSSDRSYKANGVSEYFKYTYSGSASQPIKISFERNYSRLRVFAGKGVDTVTLKSDEFLINGIQGLTAASGLTQDSKSGQWFGDDFVNNVYFYGSWEAGAVLYINKKEFKMTKASVDGVSYAIDLQKGSEPTVTVTSGCDNGGVGKIHIEKGAKINGDHILKALECNDDYSIKITGEIESDEALSDLIEQFNKLVTDLAPALYGYIKLDLSDLTGVSEVHSRISVDGLYSLTMPRQIRFYDSRSMYFDGLNRFIILEGEISSSPSAFKYANHTTLVLGKSVTPSVENGNTWCNVTWGGYEPLME